MTLKRVYQTQFSKVLRLRTFAAVLMIFSTSIAEDSASSAEEFQVIWAHGVHNGKVCGKVFCKDGYLMLELEPTKWMRGTGSLELACIFKNILDQAVGADEGTKQWLYYAHLIHPSMSTLPITFMASPKENKKLFTFMKEKSKLRKRNSYGSKWELHEQESGHVVNITYLGLDEKHEILLDLEIGDFKLRCAPTSISSNILNLECKEDDNLEDDEDSEEPEKFQTILEWSDELTAFKQFCAKCDPALKVEGVDPDIRRRLTARLLRCETRGF